MAAKKKPLDVKPAQLGDARVTIAKMALPAERAAGRIRGPLHGIPIAIKDNIHTTDIPTTGGALAFGTNKDQSSVAPDTVLASAVIDMPKAFATSLRRNVRTKKSKASNVHPRKLATTAYHWARR